MNKKVYLLLLTIIISSISFINAQDKPIQIALFNPVQICPENTSIAGLRWDIIYGKNNNVLGLDFGLVNQTTGTQSGAQWGFVNLVEGGFKGFESGFVNATKGNSLGLQGGFVNYHGGFFNGVQIAVINYTETLKGLQLGLINIIGKGGFLPVFVLFNFDFD